MGQAGQELLTSTGKVWSVGQAKKISAFCSVYNVYPLFQNLQKWPLTCKYCVSNHDRNYGPQSVFPYFVDLKTPLIGHLLSATCVCVLQLCGLIFQNWEQSPVPRSGYECKQTKLKEFYCCSSSYFHCRVQITEISIFAPLYLLLGNRYGYYTQNQYLPLFIVKDHWVQNSEVSTNQNLSYCTHTILSTDRLFQQNEGYIFKLY